MPFTHIGGRLRRTQSLADLFQDVPKPAVASGAAIAGPGVVTDFPDGSQTERGDGVNQAFFGDLEAMANKASRTPLAVGGRAGGSHGYNPQEGRKRIRRAQQLQLRLNLNTIIIIKNFDPSSFIAAIFYPKAIRLGGSKGQVGGRACSSPSLT
jgi:hypothetical protein